MASLHGRLDLLVLPPLTATGKRRVRQPRRRARGGGQATRWAAGAGARLAVTDFTVAGVVAVETGLRVSVGGNFPTSPRG